MLTLLIVRSDYAKRDLAGRALISLARLRKTLRGHVYIYIYIYADGTDVY